MFRRKKQPPVTTDALEAVARAESDIRKVESQQVEVNQIVHRLQRRERKNNFAASLEKAMRSSDA